MMGAQRTGSLGYSFIMKKKNRSMVTAISTWTFKTIALLPVDEKRVTCKIKGHRTYYKTLTINFLIYIKLIHFTVHWSSRDRYNVPVGIFQECLQ